LTDDDRRWLRFCAALTMAETLIVKLSSFWVGEDLIGFHNVLKNPRSLRADSIRVIAFQQFSKSLPDAAGTLRTRYAQTHVVVLCHWLHLTYG
jgi:hypothetical protein